MCKHSESDAFGGYSEQNSRFKLVNEDAGVAGSRLAVGGGWVRFVAVADGISGLDAGALAAKMAVEAFEKFANGLCLKSWDASQSKQKFLEYFEIVNGQIANISDRGAGCTFTGILETPSFLMLAHVGDSSCYELGVDANGDGAIKLTSDHTEIAHARRQGLNEEDLDLLHQHALHASLGDTKFTMDVHFFERTKSDSWFLVTTDGITDVLTVSDILIHRRSSNGLSSFARNLCATALTSVTPNGKPNRDNITVVVLGPSTIPKKNSTKRFGAAQLNRRASSTQPAQSSTIVNKLLFGASISCILTGFGIFIFLFVLQLFQKSSYKDEEISVNKPPLLDVEISEDQFLEEPVVNKFPLDGNRSVLPVAEMSEKFGFGGVGGLQEDPNSIPVIAEKPLHQSISPKYREHSLHIVKEGEILFKIFDQYSSRYPTFEKSDWISQVVELNSLPENGNELRPGQTLKLPYFHGSAN